MCSSDLLLLVPFFIKKESAIPRLFGNEGRAYENPAPAPREGAHLIEPELARFTWKDCESSWCSASALVSWRVSGPRLRATIRFEGAPLEQPSEWTGPGWVQAWLGPFLEARCGSETTRIRVLESVGINPHHAIEVSGMRQAYNSILAPVERTIELECRGPLRALSMGRAATLLYGIEGIRELHPMPLVLELPQIGRAHV